MTKIKNFIWSVFAIICTYFILSHCTDSICLAAEQTTTPLPPLLSASADNQGYTITVSTDAPLYMLEWDTSQDFLHKQAHAFFKGTEYDAFLRGSRQTKLSLCFPNKNKTYYIRAYSIYLKSNGGYSISKASKKISVKTIQDSVDNSSAHSSKKQAKLSAPAVKVSHLKKERLIKLTITLPKKSTGYMVECSSRKSFCYKTCHLLYTDDGNYVVRWSNHLTNRKQIILLPYSEFSGKQTYIRVYAINESSSAREAVISPPSAIKKASWK